MLLLVGFAISKLLAGNMQKNMIQPSEGGQLSETIDLTEKPTRGDNIT